MPVFEYESPTNLPFLRNGYNCESSLLKVGMVTIQGVVLSIDWDTSTGGGSYETVTGDVIFGPGDEHTILGQLAPDLMSRLLVSRAASAPPVSAALARG